MTDPVLPLHLSLVGRLVVVVGGGPIGARKVASALDAGAVVRLITPWACPDLTALADAGRVRWLSRNYWAGDLTGAWLAFAATADPKVNEAVQLEANTRRISSVVGRGRCKIWPPVYLLPRRGGMGLRRERFDSATP
jgi:uroporphyrin-III C-methyltransferase/precorrin-2 dehydrogenase/sirohydrochlorin ferrochelatase